MSTIKVVNLTKKYDYNYALNNLSFEVPSGSVCGFLGPNGAGKTTTMKLLMGLTTKDSGQISILDKDVTYGEPLDDVRFLQDVPTFYPYMTAYEYLDFICQLNNIESPKKEKKINDILKLVGLSESRDKRIGKYSRGMKQRIGIAANIISNPKILLLDEPVSALDPIGRKEIFTLIDNLKKKMTIVFSTHILDDIEKVCDRVIIINRGKKIIEGSIDEVKKKYLKNMIEVKFITKKDMLSFQKDFNIKDNTQYTIDSDNITIKIINHDVNAIQQKIIGILNKNKMSVMSMKIITPTLEEIFMGEVVNK